MGHRRNYKSAFFSTAAAAAIAMMMASSSALAIEATEIGPGQGAGGPPGLAGKGEGPWAKAGSTLRRVFAAHAAHQSAASGAPFTPGNPSVRVANGLILIDAVSATGDGAALLAELQALGLKNGTAYRHVASGYMPLGRLKKAMELGSLRAISASLKPQTNSAIDPVFGLVHDRRAAIAMGLIAGEADPQTYTAAGIKVGVLSDTFDNNGGSPATNADDDLSNGDLPGGESAYVALHTPGDVDDNDSSAFGANGTSGADTTAGDATQSINRSASIRFNPASFNSEPVTAVVTYPDADQYTIGAAPFSIEMWTNFETVYSASTQGPAQQGAVFASHYSSGAQRAWFLRTRSPDESNPNTLHFYASPDGGSGSAVSLRWPWTPSAGQWYHVAVTRDENNLVRAFIDGQQIGVSQSLNMSIFDSSEDLRISSYKSNLNNSRPFDGWIQDFRFVVGEALYTSNFTPPTTPLASELPPSSGATTTVLEEGLSAGIDEGRAMMQLIHDVAPDADLEFHSAFNGLASFAQGIEDLAANGADVIVDDVLYFAEPMFQDGIVAQAVDNVVSQGVAYFSAAGNSAQNSYESPFVSSGEPLTVGSEDRGTLHDFNDGPGPADYMQSVTIPANTTFTAVIQWDQPFASNCVGCPGPINDVDIYLVDDNLQILTAR